MNNQKMRLLSLVLAAAIALGSVTAFADGEPVTPETTETTEMETRETEGSWNGDTYTDNQGIVYELNDDGQTVTLTNGRSATGAITIPDAIEKDGTSYPVDSIGNHAFGVCTALVSVTFSGDVDSIGRYAFGFCDALENVTFSGDVGSIGDYAFYSCDALVSVTFSGDVDSIGRYVFDFCDALESVTFSGDVGSIGDSAFFGCDVLTTIYVPASMPEETVQIIRDALTGSGLRNVQIVQPEQPSDPATDPSTPSAPSTGTTGSASNAVQQLEAAERPDPMDVEATERYSFWMGVKSDLRAAADGKTLRVHVPADYTNMPASVMEQIRLLDKEITVDLRWNGERLIITPATAQRKTALKAFWTFEQLCELYAQ